MVNYNCEGGKGPQNIHKIKVDGGACAIHSSIIFRAVCFVHHFLPHQATPHLVPLPFCTLSYRPFANKAQDYSCLYCAPLMLCPLIYPPTLTDPPYR